MYVLTPADKLLNYVNNDLSFHLEKTIESKINSKLIYYSVLTHIFKIIYTSLIYVFLLFIQF